MKTRFLLVNEASYIESGLGKYGRALLTGLKEKGYQVAELAFNGFVNHGADYRSPWRFYANQVFDNDPRKENFRNNERRNKYGAWRFDRVICDFKPHVVGVVGDPWYYDYIDASPLRSTFNFLAMPTYDAIYYKKEFLQQLINAEGVLTYSKWASKKITEQSRGKVNMLGPAYAGVYPEINKPLDNKQELRKKWGLDSKPIFGSVMRNQPRKLIPDLMYAFSEVVHYAEKDCYLYLHTGYPDVNHFNIPRLLHEHRIADRVWFTYLCKGCDKWSPSLFKGELTRCPHCRQYKASLAKNNHPLDDAGLNEVYNLFDVYVQLANAAGFEMPVAEAAACGLPCVVLNYAAMCDFVETIDAKPVGYNKLELSPTEDNYRASVSLTSLVEKMVQSLEDLPVNAESIRNKCLKYYTWDKVVDRWADAIESLNHKTYDFSKSKISKKLLPTKPHKIHEKIIKEFGEYLTLTSFTFLKKVICGEKSIEDYEKFYHTLVFNYNSHQNMYLNSETLEKEDYIKYADIKSKIYD